MPCESKYLLTTAVSDLSSRNSESNGSDTHSALFMLSLVLFPSFTFPTVLFCNKKDRENFKNFP